MSFVDYIFIPFMFLAVILYFQVPMKWRWVMLLAVSLVFYCSWGIALLPFVTCAVLLAWAASLWMERQYNHLDEQLKAGIWSDRAEQGRQRQKVKNRCKYVLWLTAAILVAILAASKMHWISIGVPLGISYYTMSLIGYMADVYWRKEKAEHNYFSLLLFAVYFPKILEGPISKHRLVAEQLREGHAFDYQRFCFGLQRVLWGYFKKLAIADRLNILVSTVFTDYESYHGAAFVVAAVFGAFQLYCDFSGCMDIALGISEVFGITIEENFNRPFFSKTAAEFWRRWHITLGVWFKDYIYMPLVISPRLIRGSGKIRKKCGKRAGKAFVTVIPLLTVWILTGVWHGTGWNYVAWGLYWGGIIIVSTVFEPELLKLTRLLRIDTKTRGWQLFQTVRTFCLFVGSRLLTIPTDLNITWYVLRRIFKKFAPWELVDGTLYTLGLERPDFIFAILALVLLFYVSKKEEEGFSFRERIAKLPLVCRWIVYYGAILAVLIFGVYGAGYNAAAFVYMNY